MSYPIEEVTVNTMEEAVAFAIKALEDNGDIEVIKNLIDREDKNLLNLIAIGHHGFGTWLRNTLGLWHVRSEALREDIWYKISPERRKFYNDHWTKWGSALSPFQGRHMHADDASGELMGAIINQIIVDLYGQKK